MAKTTAPIDERQAERKNTALLGVWMRLFYIGSVLTFVSLRILFPIAYSCARGRRDVRDRCLGEAFARAAEHLGPVWVKVGQMLSYRIDLISEGILAPLAQLQEHVQPARPLKTRAAAEAGLPCEARSVFACIDETPIACGSIASVHRGVTTAGDIVAVKIVRPGTRASVQKDLACLRWIVRQIARIPFANEAPVTEIFDSIAETIAAQCDMLQEGENLQRLRDSLGAIAGLTIPRWRADVAATPDILVMDYVADTLPIISSALPDTAYRCAIHIVLRALYIMIFSNGFIHCDQHPGNVRGRPDGTACLFDAGLVVSLTEEDRLCFRDFFVSFALGCADGMTKAIIQSAASVPGDLDAKALKGDVAALVRTYSGRQTGSFLVVEFVYRIFALQRRYGIIGAPGFVSAIWALVMFEGLVRTRYPDLDFQREAVHVLSKKVLPRRHERRNNFSVYSEARS